MRTPVARFAACLWLCLSAALSAQAWHRVDRVVDGDTAVLHEVGPVRLIGVDTPETQDPREPVQRFGVEASAFLQRLIGGQTVRLEFDLQRVDKYRRTLGYLYLADGTFVNREIVRQGYGHAYLDYPFAYADDFRNAEREAREAERGLWGTSDQSAINVPAHVWVNTASRVYHCPGTRYYGKTARGEYLDEVAAIQRGYRAAGGRRCSPPQEPDTATPVGTAERVAPQPLAAASALPSQSARVWVNTSSRVYHCEGSRYFGRTARGEYLPEAAALASGYRPAGGRQCGPPASTTSSVPPSTPPLGVASAPPTKAVAAPSARVWVNTISRVYHCPGTRYYGTTKQGIYLDERDAQAQGFRPAAGRGCS